MAASVLLHPNPTNLQNTHEIASETVKHTHTHAYTYTRTHRLTRVLVLNVVRELHSHHFVYIFMVFIKYCTVYVLHSKY